MQSMAGQDAMSRASLLAQAQASYFGAQTEQGSYDQRHNQMQWAAHPAFAPNPAPPNPYGTIPANHETQTDRSGGILTRRRRAAIAQIQNAPPQLFPVGDQLTFPSAVYGLHDQLDAVHGHQSSRPVSPDASFSANPNDISPLARRTHSRHPSSNSAFDPEPISPISNYARGQHAFMRASSPASSIASSSITSLSGSFSLHSQSTWSSATNESSPARIADIDELSSSASPEGNQVNKEKHTKNKLRNADRKDICLYAERFPNTRQEDIAIRFGVERSTVSKVLKNKAHWLSLEDEEVLKIAKHRPIKFPEIESEVAQWVQEKAAAGELINDASLKDQAKAAARRRGIGEDQFKASGGWIENFKQRHRIKRGKVYPPRSERSIKHADVDDQVSLHSTDDKNVMDEVAPAFAAINVNATQDANLFAHPTTFAGPPLMLQSQSERSNPPENHQNHAYPTRRKTVDAYQLQQSVNMMRSFIHEVHPEGFTDEQRGVWEIIQQRTLKWAMDVQQMQNHVL